jgi:phosphatidate cytidylyltransferase
MAEGIDLTKRVLSSVVGFPLLLFFIGVGGEFLRAALFCVSVIGVFELQRAFFKKFKGVGVFAFIACGVFVFLYGRFNSLLISVYILFVGCAVYMALDYDKTDVSHVLVVIFSFLYVPFLLINVYEIRISENGAFFAWLVFIGAWCCDIGAYHVGKKFGKKKIAPKLSPNKTVAGSVGGTAFAAVAGAAYGFAATFFNFTPPGYSRAQIAFYCFFICGVGSVFGQFGDLLASGVKRKTEIKDFGKIMPGHGGVLDRFDSVLLASPAIRVLIFALFEIF